MKKILLILSFITILSCNDEKINSIYESSKEDKSQLDSSVVYQSSTFSYGCVMVNRFVVDKDTFLIAKGDKCVSLIKISK